MSYGYFYPGSGSSSKLSAEQKRVRKNRQAREQRAAEKKARERRVFWDRCEAVVDGILALPAESAAYLPEIPKLFEKAGANAGERYAVFQELDERPGKFWRPGVEYWAWHGKLRQVRNHPVHGRELFAAINGE